jgi:site-specific DNA recombinase
MESQKTRVVAYIRISSMRQIDNESPVTQRASIQRYAEDHNFEIVEWFEDIAKSGKNADRDGLQNLLKYCMKHKNQIDHWIVYNMKRASRDVDTYSSEVRLVLKALGITVRSATEPAVNDTKEGRFMENLLVMLGQLDNEGKAEVTIDNMKSLAFQGYWQHPPIVGYEICKIPNDLGKPRPSLKPSQMAEKVKQVLERFSEGDISKAELTRFAAKVGLRSRYDNKLSEDSINRLIKNPTYAGFVSDKFTEYELINGKHPALISIETFERNQALLYGNKSRKDQRHSRHNPDYPLKGLILCLNCHNPLYASAPRTGNGSSSPRYHCSRSTCKGLVKSIKSDVVHLDFIEMLKTIKPSTGILKLYKEVLVRQANTELGRLNFRLSAIRNELSELDATRVNTIRKYTDDAITLEEKQEVMGVLDQQKATISNALKELEQQQFIREQDIENAISVMENVAYQWIDSTSDIKSRFQTMLFPEGLVYDFNSHKFGTSEISPLYRYIGNKKDLPESEKSFLVAGAGFEPATLWL